VVVHSDLSTSNTVVQTRPVSSGSWTLDTIRSGAMLDTPYNLATDGSNAYLLMKDITANQLLFGNMTGGWSLSQVLTAPAPGTTFPVDLVRYGSNWVSPLRDATNKRFILIKGSATPWSIEEISADNVGANARMDTDGVKAAIVYYSAKWLFTYNDGGGWDTSEITIPGNSPSGRPDVVFLNGSPYIVFWDTNSDKIKAAKGTPPPG
jgi:hypothetical protein